MEELLELNIDPGTAAAMAMTGARAVYAHWFAADPVAAAHLQTGWHVAVEVVVTTDPVTLRISYVDPANGTRYVQASVPLPAAAIT